MDNAKRDIKRKALTFLARREYAYNELFKRLCQCFTDEKAIKSVLEELKAKDFLSEKRYIQSYLNAKISKIGLTKIRYLLKTKTTDESLVEEIIQENPIDQYSVAKTLLVKKFGEQAKSNDYDDEQKLLAKKIRFLQNKGFSFELIRKILAEF